MTIIATVNYISQVLFLQYFSSYTQHFNSL